MKSLKLLPLLIMAVLLFATDMALAQTTVTIGTGTSSSSTRGPFQRADTNSTTVFSRWIQVFTATELATAGLTNGVTISQLNWELASSNVIIGSGNANLKIYIKNSTATAAVADTWVNHTAGATLVKDENYNTSNNFPGANGWMPFTFNAPFTYTGGAIEVMVDWDCSQVSTPAFSGNGAIKWRWHSTAPDQLVVKKTSSSAPSTSITDLKDERANIQIVYNTAAACVAPASLNASNITSTSADLNWAASPGAMDYNWKVVATGAGVGGATIDAGTTTNTMVTANNLSVLTSYDFYVEANCGVNGTSGFSGPYTFTALPSSLDTIKIGMGTSSSSTRGPFQRSDTNSSTVFSRFVHVYTATELAAAGITAGTNLTEVQWELASSNTIIGSGDATLKVYIKNSTATSAISDTWVNHITGATLVVDRAFNTTNNFPGANGWMPFNFSTPFAYTGGALEIAVDWDCSQVSTPAFSGDGSLKWRWESTAPDQLVVKKTSSSSPSSSITDLKDERANIQMVYAATVLPPDSVDVTFSVNAALVTTDPAGLFLAGGGTFGNPGDNPMADPDGDDVWEITVRLPKGASTDYTFTNGNCPNWGCKEDIAGLPCAVAPWNDRNFPGAWSDTTILACFGACESDGTCPAPPAMIDVTFSVDMSSYTGPGYTTVNINGIFNGWCGGCTPMTDMGNNIWEVTVPMNSNDSTEYKFTVDGWTGQENLTPGSSCTKTSGPYTNRFLTWGASDVTIPTVCWESCDACPATLYDVTFKVDMSLADSIASDGVFLAGAFNGWSDTAMTDMDNDSIYELTLPLAESTTYEFKFKNGASGWEQINLGYDSTCVIPGGFGNRGVTVGTADTTLMTYCFETCVSCDIVLPTKFVPQTAKFDMMPNPANSYVQLVFNDEFIATEKAIFVQNAMGQVVMNTIVSNRRNYNINTSTLADGLYFITVKTEEGIHTERLVVRH